MSEPSKKERTRQRIVESAARALRQRGFDGLGVADVMKDAGLTHGGFYAHFPSREALLSEALDHAAAQSAAYFAGAEAETLPSLIDGYLSDAHADHPERGCSLAALGSETPRQAPEVRAVATRRLNQSLEHLEKVLRGSAAERRECAMATMATLVGALVLSRAVSDRKLARAIRAAARKFLHAATTKGARA